MHAPASQDRSAAAAGQVPPLVPALLVALTFGLGALAVWQLPMNHDASWLLYLGGRLLDGGRLYIDYTEVNPPLIVWLSMGVAWLARQAGLAPDTLWRALVLAGAALAMAWSARLLRSWLAPAAGWPLLALLAYATVAMHGYDFGQREHLALLAVLPYLAEAARRAAGQAAARHTQLAVAAWAALGLALKPHFLLVAVLVEGLAAWRTARRPGPGLWLMGALWCLYGGAVLLLTPGYLPMVNLFAHMYWHYDSAGWVHVLTVPQCLAALILAGVAWALRPAPRALAQVLSAAALGFAVAALVQHKLWSYHWYPALALCWLLFAQAGAAVLAPRRWRGRPLAPLAGGVVAALLAALALADAASARHPPNPYPALLAPAIGQLGGGPVLVLAHTMQAAFPLVTQPGIGSSSRYPSMAIAVAASQSGDAAVERYLRRTFAEDMRRHPPALLVVEGGADGAPGSFDFLAYFSQDPAMAVLLQRYRPVRTVGPFRILQPAPVVFEPQRQVPQINVHAGADSDRR
jgi:hypothetical protein